MKNENVISKNAVAAAMETKASNTGILTMMKYCKLIPILLLLTSCVAVDHWQRTDASYSNVTYVKNTLDYPVLVQCYFRPFNDNPFWCGNELIPYSEPVEIRPNESKIVMDYVNPCGIKVFKSSDNSLLFEAFEERDNTFTKSFLSTDVLTTSTEEAKKLGKFTTKEVLSKPWLKVFNSKYNFYIQDERYLYKNVPWSLYPIQFEFVQCYENLLEGDENRKKVYKEVSDGYALVNCIVFNTNAACFKH